jgi:hypothetical protein
VTGRAGTLVVAELADRLGLTMTLFEGMSPLVQRLRRRDPGVALTHLALVGRRHVDSLTMSKEDG